MSEGYEKIELEDVKKGQRIQVALYHDTHIVSYTGNVVDVDVSHDIISLGYGQEQFRVYLTQPEVPDIFLLEDVSEPKVVRTETVTITHYDDGTTTTQTPVEESRVPTRIETVEQFEAYEGYLKRVFTKDRLGDYWTYRDGRWRWFSGMGDFQGAWTPTSGTAVIRASLPLTVVENAGD